MVNTAANRATSPPINPLQTSIVTSSSSLQQYHSLSGNGTNSGMNGNSKQFCDNFWGDKINGFDVLCQNLKHSLTSVKDLETFLRESANCEDSYGKVLNKLVTQINRFSSNGSFNPLWLPLKELNEKYALKHVEMVHNLHELIRDIQRYNEELSKKIKKIRENEIQTQNIVQNFQDIQLNLNKSKEQYHNLCVEFEKQKRLLDPQQMAQYQQQQLQQQISSTNLMQSTVTTANSNNAGLSFQINGGGSISTTSTSIVPNLSNTNNNNNNNITNNNTNNTSNINLQSLVANSNNTSSSSQQQSSGQSASPAPITSTTDRLSSLASSITVSKVSQVQKIEKKLRLSLEEYKSTIEKYNSIRIDFERKLADSCNHFQYTEETHLKQMRVFIESYSKLVSNCNTCKQQIYNDFHIKFEQFTSDYLLKLFVDNKGTGTERPEMAQFIDQFDYAKLTLSLNNNVVLPNPNTNNNNNNTTTTNQTLINETDFNLFINGGNQFTNTSLNTSYSTTTTNNNNNNGILPPPPPPMPSVVQPSYSQQNSMNSNQNLISSISFSNDSVDNKSNSIIDSSNTGGQSRGTPIFFSSSNIMSSVSNSFYSPLTNSVSTTTLNSIQQSAVTNSTVGTASPINFSVQSAQQTQGTSITPTNIPTNITTTTSNTTNTNTNENMKRSDSKGINIFNVDFLGRKNKEKKAKAAAAAAAAAALSAQNNQQQQQQQQQQQTNTKVKASKSNKKNKQQQNISASSSTNTNQYENLNSSTTTTSTMFANNAGLSISNNSNRDSSSINSEDSNERNINNNNNIIISEQIVITNPDMILNTQIQSNQNGVSNTNQNVGGSITARSISSITGSLSFDLLDQLNINKISNGSDIDSEGYSIRPESSMGQRRIRKKDEPLRNKDNEDMNNLYASSSTTNSDDDSDDSDSENGDGSGGGPRKVNIKINPKDPADEKKKINDDVLREISKNLQLIKPSNNMNLFNSGKQTNKKRTYYYNYGTANPDQATSGWSTSNLLNSPDVISKPSITESTDNSLMHRSISVGSVVQNNNFLLDDFKFSPTTTTKTTAKQQTTDSLFDFGINFSPKSTNNTTTTTTTTPPANVPVSISMNKVTDTNLYNIEEDKEVESSFQYDLKRNNPYVSSSSPANNATSSTTTINSNQINGGGGGGRFTPACFPGRTTPDFRITTSLFEQQGTRASIISPLTVNNTVGCDTIIPIAVAFNETIHAYFKTGDTSKFKVKCFGCMKISFPFAVLKYLTSDLPQFEFRLNNLQIANQDLKINNQLLNRITDQFGLQSTSTPSPSNQTVESLQFKFLLSNLVQELKKQHQENKLAAFFNFELLKYEFKYSTTPLVLNANWSSNLIDNTIELNLNYSFNFRKNLSQVNFMIVMPKTNVSNSTDKITLLKSEPTALVQEPDNKLQILWQMPILNSNGTLMAKFSIPGSFMLNQSLNSTSMTTTSMNSLEQFYQPVYVKFNIENETLSQVKFEITSNNYKLSLLKERIETGKYFCNNDHQQTMNQQVTLSDQSLLTNNKKPAVVGNLSTSLSTSIGSTVDIFLNN